MSAVIKPFGRVFFIGVLSLAALASPAAPEVLPASSPYGAAIVTTNISYVSNPAPRQNFDLYLPQITDGKPLPFILWIHGGAWMMGIKDWDNVKYLVSHGYAIASIDYRIAPQDRFPAQIQDCNAALNFIVAHAGDYGLNPKELIIGGGSAGGHLALLLGFARHEKNFGADPSIRPLAILDFFGLTDLTHALDDLQAIHSQKGIELFQDAGAKLLGAPVDQSADKLSLASPMHYLNAGSAPTLILDGSKDDLVPAFQGRRLHQAMDALGIKNQFILVDNAGHDGPLFSTPAIQTQVIHFLNGVLANPDHNPQ
jgi:acetyl esterase/lipase